MGGLGDIVWGFSKPGETAVMDMGHPNWTRPMLMRVLSAPSNCNWCTISYPYCVEVRFPDLWLFISKLNFNLV